MQVSTRLEKFFIYTTTYKYSPKILSIMDFHIDGDNVIPLLSKLYTGINYQKQSRFISLQKWEGYVIKVNSESFIARLIDKTNQGPDEEAEFSFEEIEEEDRELLKEGAVFYWNIGYLNLPSGRIRSSLVRFRRFPMWSQEEIEIAKSKAKIIQDELGWVEK